MEGFISWVNKLRRAYASRRDFALDILKREMGEDADLISCVAPEAYVVENAGVERLNWSAGACSSG
jgi:hypothetical protein